MAKRHISATVAGKHKSMSHSTNDSKVKVSTQSKHERDLSDNQAQGELIKKK